MNIKKFVATLLPWKKSSQLKTFNDPGVEYFSLSEQNTVSSQEKEKKEDEKRRQAEIKQFQQEVDFFIQSKDIKSLVQYLEEGYVITPSQFQTICQKQKGWFKKFPSPRGFESENVDNIEAFQRYLVGYYMPQIKNFVYHGLLAFEERKNKDLESHKNFTTAEGAYYHRHTRQRFEQSSHNHAWEAVLNFKFAAFLIEQYPDIFRQDSELFRLYQTQASEYRDFLTKTKKDLVSYGEKKHPDSNYGIFHTEYNKSLEFLDNFISENFADMKHMFLKEKLDRLRQVYTTQDSIENLQDDLKKNLSLKITGLEKSSIPTAAWKIIDNIKREGHHLEKNADKLSPEDQFEVKNLTQKVLLEALNGYVAILPEHRAHLKNEEGKSLDSLFMESLQHIEAQLKEKSQAVAESQFKEVKITHQYLRAKK